MRSRRTKSFHKHWGKLPLVVQRQAQRAWELWSQDPWHSSLQFKKVAPGVWSVRIDGGYRALGRMKGDTVHWFWIGDHDSYEREIQKF